MSTVTTSNGIGGVLTTNYKYGGYKAEVGTGRGSLGFNWIEATQVETGLVTRTTYEQAWPYVGLPKQVERRVPGGGNGGLLSQTVTTYGCLDPATGLACVVGSNKRYHPYASKTVESRWDLNGSAFPVVTTDTSIDAWGNPTTVTVSLPDGSTRTTTNTYAAPDIGNWFLGRLIRSVVTSTTP